MANEIAEQGYNEVTDVVSAPAGTLNPTDIANIVNAVVAALLGAGAAGGTILLDGGLSIDVSASGYSDQYGNLKSGVGDTGSVDLVIRDDSSRIPLDGWTAVGNMSTYDTGAAVSSDVACTIPYGPGGVVRYPRQAADTETAGRYLLEIKLSGPAGQSRTVGPVNHIVS